MDYSTLLGTIAALDSDAPSFYELEPLNSLPKEGVMSSLSSFAIYGGDPNVFSSAANLKARQLSILNQLWQSTSPKTIVHDLLWFELFYLDIRRIFRNHATPQSSWSEIKKVLDQEQPEWEYLEAHFEDNFEYLIQTENSYLIQELTLDYIKIEVILGHYAKADDIIKGYLELTVDFYNSLLSGRMTLAGRDPKIWRKYVFHLPGTMVTERYELLSHEGNHNIDIALLGETNLARTSPAVIEQNYRRYLRLYTNQALFAGSAELETIRALHHINSCFELTQILLFATKRPERLDNYNYNQLMV